MDIIKIEADADTKFVAGIGKYNTKAREFRLKQDTAEREMESIVRHHIMPYMPQTLFACYTIMDVSIGYGHPLKQFTLILLPRVNMHDPEKSKVAMGTITKVVQALSKHGWEITEEPQAKAYKYVGGMTIELSAVWTLKPSLIDRMARKVTVSRHIVLDMQFRGGYETDRCKLVEEEVTIPSHYEPERKETRMKVVCDDEA